MIIMILCLMGELGNYRKGFLGAFAGFSMIGCLFLILGVYHQHNYFEVDCYVVDNRDCRLNNSISKLSIGIDNSSQLILAEKAFCYPECCQSELLAHQKLYCELNRHSKLVGQVSKESYEDQIGASRILLYILIILGGFFGICYVLTIIQDCRQRNEPIDRV